MTRPSNDLPSALPSRDWTVRSYRAADREAVRQVACATGFHGGPIDAFYADRESFADWATGYFTDRDSRYAFVACRGTRVEGYLVIAGDGDAAERHGRRVLLRHLLLRAVWLRPGCAGFFRRVVADTVRDRGGRRPEIDRGRYPGAMHMNLLPEARRKGVGVELLRMAYAAIVADGMTGVHGFVDAENPGIVALVRHVGGAPLGEPYPVPGLRTPDGRRVFGRALVLELPR